MSKKHKRIFEIWNRVKKLQKFCDEFEELEAENQRLRKIVKHCHEFFATTPFHETEYIHPVTREIIDKLYDETELE